MVDTTKGKRSAEMLIPNKLYFRIGEVSDLVGVKPYVLRYWESEFGDIKPSKSKSGQRLYKRRDVELLLKIRELLYDERFTINGARKRLKDLARQEGHAVMQVEEFEAPDPEQLEVFEEEEIIHEAPKIARPSIKEPAIRQQSSHESKKVFQKIKRDLENLLQVVKG